jgi:hypothetical protein
MKEYLLGKRMSSGRGIFWEERRGTRKVESGKWKKERRGEGKEERARKGTYDNDTHTSPHNFDNY